MPVGALVTADPDGDMSDSDYFLYTYRRTDTAASDPDLNIWAEYGTNLTAWTPAVHGEDGVVILAIDNDFGTAPDIDRVDVYIPKIGTELFARLKVESTAP